MKAKIIIISSGIILSLAIFYFLWSNDGQKIFFQPTDQTVPQGIKLTENNPSENLKKDIEIISQNLQIPWEIAFLPEGDRLITERPGTLRRIGKSSASYKIESVAHIGEGGLLGLTLHPRFSENGWIYLYSTTRKGGSIVNRVERYRLEENGLNEKTIILDDIPGSSNHNGGRIAFGPDKLLYITTGDSSQEQLAQDTKSLAGKILRIKDDGTIPTDNPFGNAVYSYGHRNPQGLAWDNQGRLWATEHGRSGLLSGYDELNLIEKGKNYGWPVIQGDEKRNGMETPIVNSGPSETWAPAGLAYLNGSLFFGGLRGESLYEAKITGERQVSLKAHLRKEFGRIRAVVLGPENDLYISTSNRDGRGTVKEGDDKIIKINPSIFK